jgi:uncharacterized protein (TIGR02271 family)
MSDEDYTRWVGQTAVDADGDKIGAIEEVYLDDDSNAPAWVTVHTGLFGGHVTFVPLAGARPDGDDLRLGYRKAQVKGAPRFDPDDDLSHEDEAELYDYYGSSSKPGSDDASADPSGESTSMTRSEEELRVGTETVESGRARLRKYVVTEQQQVTVPVRREEVRVEREPLGADAQPSDAEIGDDEQEIVLHEERPVVETEVVPKETVRLTKEETTDEQEIDGEVRKEQIDVDDGRQAQEHAVGRGRRGL